MTARGFTVRTLRTTVAAAHGAPFPERVRREVWFVEPTDAAVVLGSAQRLTTLDLGEVARRGLGVVRRGSGGGAVVVEPGASTWFDVWLPADDPLADTDVGTSADWLAAAVTEALGRLGMPAQPVSADEAAGRERSRCGPLVCFAATSGGEVEARGRKVVGISQRRTRAGARFQVSVLHRFDPEATAALFALDAVERRALTDHLARTVTVVEATPAAVREAVVAVLRTR